MSQQNKPIRNVRSFVRAYLNSNSGQAALARKDIRVFDKNTKRHVTVNRNNQMATAFQQALEA